MWLCCSFVFQFCVATHSIRTSVGVSASWIDSKNLQAWETKNVTYLRKAVDELLEVILALQSVAHDRLILQHTRSVQRCDKLLHKKIIYCHLYSRSCLAATWWAGMHRNVHETLIWG